MKISVCIPYRARLANLRFAFDSLSQQSLGSDNFEVVVGVMEYDRDYVDLCREFEDRLDIISVMSGRDFHIPHARNLAMRAATGDVIVQMDADTLLDREALKLIWGKFSFGQRVCVIGQVVGYGNNQDGDVEHVPERSFEEYAVSLAVLRASEEWPADPRFQETHNIPWAFGWTGLVALRRLDIVENQLWFDEDFRGWGVDDLEWSFRISEAKIPIILQEEVFALHLPHVRDSGANQRTEARNFDRFIRKWPRLDVELAKAFGDVEANRRWPDYVAALSISGGYSVQVTRNKDGDSLEIGVAKESGTLSSSSEFLDLTGLALPFDDDSFRDCRISPRILRLPEDYVDAVIREAERVSQFIEMPS